MTIVKRYVPVILSVGAALALSLALHHLYPQLYLRPLVFLALLFSIWGRGLGPSLMGAALATVAVGYLPPQVASNQGILFDAGVFALGAVAINAFSGAKLKAEAQRTRVEEQLRTSERRLIGAQRMAQIGSWERYLGAEGIYWSDEMFRIFGLPAGPPPSLQTLLTYVHPDDRTKVVEFVEKARTDLEPVTVECRIVRPDGEVRFARSVAEILRDGTDKRLRLVGTTQDITEQVQAKAALRESENLFQGIFLQAAVGIAQVSVNGEWLLVNDRFCEMLGYTEAELRKETLLGLTHPDDRERAQAALRRLKLGEISSWSAEKRYVRKDGATVWVRPFVSLSRDQAMAPEYFIIVVEDITGKILADRALNESEQRLTLAQGAAHLGLWERDLGADETVISGEYAALYGLAPGRTRIRHEEWLNLLHPDDRERVEALLQESMERSHVWDTEFRVVWPDGSVHWLLGKGGVFLDDSGRPVRFAGVNLDITELKHAEAALRESEMRFRRMADSAPVMIWATGPDKLATFFNLGWQAFTGRTMEQLVGFGWTECLYPDDVDHCVEVYSSAFAAHRMYQMEHRLRRADGEYRWVLCTGVPRFESGEVFAGYLGSCVDITDAKRAREEALAGQKLESLGILTGGIAHDFNNLLGSILAEAELAESELASGASPADEIQRIKSVAIRGAEIVRELMIYAGQDKANLEPIDVSRLVEEMLQLLKVSISKHAVLKTDLHKDLPAVRGNAPQIRQIVMNLIINASEAIGEKDGVIHVTTSRAAGSREAEDFLALEVSDTGGGMTEEEQAKVFDPFFTTKFAGRGLGLAVVQGIVRAHGGAINLVSSPGRGTTFQILLPCAGEPAVQDALVAAANPVEPVPNPGAAVLLVEDEESLRFSVAKMLRKRGFSVIEAGDGAAAVDLVRRHKDNIDVILLDVTIPGASSLEVVAEALRIHPHVKIILTSAYSRETVAASFGGPQIKGFIRKPFQLADLVELLRSTMAAPHTSAMAAAGIPDGDPHLASPTLDGPPDPGKPDCGDPEA